jgi:hypothetical protein
MKLPLGLSAFTSCHLAVPADVPQLVRVFTSYGGSLTPTRFGACEPLKNIFSEARVDVLACEIESGFVFWKSPKSFVHVTRHIRAYMHGAVSAGFTVNAFTSEALAQFVCELASVIHADLAAAHLLNEHDRTSDIRNGTRIDGADGSTFDLFPKKLVRGLPDFYWGMVFGRPYCEMFGVDRLLATPAHIVRRIAEDAVYVQLTPDIGDCVHNHAAIMQARQLAKKHLGVDAFALADSALSATAHRLPFIGKLLVHPRVVPNLTP